MKNTLRPPISTGVKQYERALRDGSGGLSEVVASAKDCDLCVALYDTVAYDVRIAPIGTARLSINLRSARVRGRVGKARVTEYAGRRHSLFYTPAGTEASWCKADPSRHLNIYFRENALEEAATSARVRAGLARPLLDAHLPGLKIWINALDAALQRDEAFAREAARHLARVILAEVVERSDRRTPYSPGRNMHACTNMFWHTSMFRFRSRVWPQERG